MVNPYIMVRISDKLSGVENKFPLVLELGYDPLHD